MSRQCPDMTCPICWAKRPTLNDVWRDQDAHAASPLPWALGVLLVLGVVVLWAVLV